MQARNGRIHGWPGPSVDVDEWKAGHPWVAWVHRRPRTGPPESVRSSQQQSCGISSRCHLHFRCRDISAGPTGKPCTLRVCEITLYFIHLHPARMGYDSCWRFPAFISLAIVLSPNAHFPAEARYCHQDRAAQSPSPYLP